MANFLIVIIAQPHCRETLRRSNNVGMGAEHDLERIASGDSVKPEYLRETYFTEQGRNASGGEKIKTKSAFTQMGYPHHTCLMGVFFAGNRLNRPSGVGDCSADRAYAYVS